MKRSSAGAAAAAGAGEEKPFEAMMERLEELVAKLEEGNLSLEESIQSFEEGMALVKKCSGVLQQAELRIQKLTREAEERVTTEGGGRSPRDEDDATDELPF
jgi:exodeoxyribonuclease VII small subunit